MTHHKLVIAEKPSVAQSIAAVLGATKRNDGYLSGGGYLVSWCFGHLAELAGADVYDEKYAKWRYDDLPILPASWRFTLKADKSKQFELLRDLMRREDVSEVINACDAGREGELIFRTVYYMAGCTKTMKRLWISSMEDEAIRKGFADLRPGREYDGLHQSALCRARADWLVGINATRLFSVLYHRTLNVGRVMTPTLALIVQREAEIGAFRPEAFYTVNLRCGDFAVVSEKFKEKAEADGLAAACAGQPVTVKAVQRTEKTEKAPLLYDLTALQREANRSLGYTAQQTLDYLQALYEKKLCTYPRTDSRFLTDDLEASVPELAARCCRHLRNHRTGGRKRKAGLRQPQGQRPPRHSPHRQRGQGGYLRPAAGRARDFAPCGGAASPCGQRRPPLCRNRRYAGVRRRCIHRQGQNHPRSRLEAVSRAGKAGRRAAGDVGGTGIGLRRNCRKGGQDHAAQALYGCDIL